MSRGDEDLYKAAEQGDAEAQFALGQMYEKGVDGGGDDAEAAHWYFMAAEQGHAVVQPWLYVCQRPGRAERL